MYRYTARAGSKRSIPALIIRLYRAASPLTGWDLCPVITIIMLSGKERERETFPLFFLSADSFRYITLWQESIAFQYSSLSSIFVMITSHHHWWSFGAPNLKLDIASEACVKWSVESIPVSQWNLFIYMMQVLTEAAVSGEYLQSGRTFYRVSWLFIFLDEAGWPQ